MIKHFLAALSTLIVAIFVGLSDIDTNAVVDTNYFDPTNFGSLDLLTVMTIARNRVESNQSTFGGTYTDYYTCAYSYEQGYDRYFVVFYQSENITMNGTNPFTFNQTTSIKANMHFIAVNISSQNNGTVTSAYGGWNSSANLNYALVTGSWYSNPVAPGNFFSTININCPNATQYSISPTPVKTYRDDVYCIRDGFSIKFGCKATLNSKFESTYFVSDQYTAEIDAVINNQNLTVFPASYVCYSVTKQVDIVQKTDTTEEFYSDKPYLTYYKYMSSVKVSKFQYPATNLPTEDSLTLTNSVTFPSDNEVTLNTLLTAFQAAYPSADISIEDLQTAITIRIKNSSKVVLTQTFDFSPLQGEQPLTEIPPDDPGTPDQFDPYKDLNEHLSSNNYYLQSLLLGEQYLSNGLSDLAMQAPDVNEFDNLSVPDYDFTSTQLDSSAMSFLDWLIHLWLETPFGIVFMAALTFLILKTIVW